MYPHRHTDPPRSPAGRLRRLTDSLRALAAELKHSVARVVGEAAADAVADIVRRLLGGGAEPPRGPAPQRIDAWEDRPRDRWEDEDARWSEEEESPAPTCDSPGAGGRWRDAAFALLEAGVCWLRRRPDRGPPYAAAALTLAAGVAGLVARPVAAVVDLLASLANVIAAARPPRPAALEG